MLHKVQGRSVKRRFRAAFRSARWRRTTLSRWDRCRRPVTTGRAFELPLDPAREFKEPRLPKSSWMWTRRPRSKSLESQCIPVDLAPMTTKACPHLVASRIQHPPEVATLGREGRKKARTCDEAFSIGGLIHGADPPGNIVVRLHALRSTCTTHSPSRRHVSGRRQTTALNSLVSLPRLLA